MQQLHQAARGSDWRAGSPVCGPNLENDRPLLEQLTVCAQKRSARIINIGRLRSRTVEFHDRQILAGLEGRDICIPDIESPHEESRIGLRNLIDTALERWRPQTPSIAEECTLRVIPGDRQPEYLPPLQH